MPSTFLIASSLLATHSRPLGPLFSFCFLLYLARLLKLSHLGMIRKCLSAGWMLGMGVPKPLRPKVLVDVDGQKEFRRTSQRLCESHLAVDMRWFGCKNNV